MAFKMLSVELFTLLWESPNYVIFKDLLLNPLAKPFLINHTNLAQATEKQMMKYGHTVIKE